MDAKRIIQLGSDLPDFGLPDTEGNFVVREHLLGASAILVAFICNQCSYVQHIREVMVKLIREYQEYGMKAVAINSNDVEMSPEDRPDKMKEDARTYGYTFPYLFDATQIVAKRFRASCTPEFFVYSKDGKLTYHGQLDDSRPGNGKPVTGKDLRMALHATLHDQIISVMNPSMGEKIIWKKNNDFLLLKSIIKKPVSRKLSGNIAGLN